MVQINLKILHDNATIFCINWSSVAEVFNLKKNILASARRRMGDQGIGADKHFTANSHQDPFSASFERRRFSAWFRFCQR